MSRQRVFTHMPHQMGARMETWQRTLGPAFQSQRVLQWTPEAEALFQQRNMNLQQLQCKSNQHGAPPWLMVACVCLIAILLLLLLVGGVKLSTVNKPSRVRK